MRSRTLWLAAGFYGAGLILGGLLGREAASLHDFHRQLALAPRLPPQPGSKPAKQPVAIAQPALEVRESATLCLAMPAGGTEYSTLEAAWLRPLDGESGPAETPQVRSIPLQFEGVKRLTGLQDGIYKLTLKGKFPERIRDCVLAPDLAVRSRDRGSASPPPSVCLPERLAGAYIGYAGIAAEPKPGESPVGTFCGIAIDLEGNRGELMVSFEPIERDRTFLHRDLRPRPDGVWPIGNLFLESPSRLAFDCPLNHGDYRCFLDRTDGHITFHARIVPPETDSQRAELLTRMRLLIRNQVRASAQAPGWYEPRFLNQPAERLPAYEKLSSPDRFEQYLTKMALIPDTKVELGGRITANHPSGEGLWRIRVLPASP